MKTLKNRLFDDRANYTPAGVERLKSLRTAMGSYEAERNMKADRRLSEVLMERAAVEQTSESTSSDRPVIVNGSWYRRPSPDQMSPYQAVAVTSATSNDRPSIPGAQPTQGYSSAPSSSAQHNSDGPRYSSYST